MTSQDPTSAKLDLCPSGHTLPHDTPRGPCTPVFCAGEEAPAPEPEGPHATPEEFRTPDLAKEVAAGERAEQRSLAKLDAQRRVRLKHLSIPEGLEGAAVDDWVAKKKVDLNVLSMAEAEWRLKYGNSAERWEVAKFNLEQTGHGKREAFGGGASPILILTGASVVLPPHMAKQLSMTQQEKELPSSGPAGLIGATSEPQKAGE